VEIKKSWTDEGPVVMGEEERRRCCCACKPLKKTETLSLLVSIFGLFFLISVLFYKSTKGSINQIILCFMYLLFRGVILGSHIICSSVL